MQPVNPRRVNGRRSQSSSTHEIAAAHPVELQVPFSKADCSSETWAHPVAQMLGQAASGLACFVPPRVIDYAVLQVRTLGIFRCDNFFHSCHTSLPLLSMNFRRGELTIIPIFSPLDHGRLKLAREGRRC